MWVFKNKPKCAGLAMIYFLTFQNGWMIFLCNFSLQSFSYNKIKFIFAKSNTIPQMLGYWFFWDCSNSSENNTSQIIELNHKPWRINFKKEKAPMDKINHLLFKWLPFHITFNFDPLIYNHCYQSIQINHEPTQYQDIFFGDHKNPKGKNTKQIIKYEIIKQKNPKGKKSL